MIDYKENIQNRIVNGLNQLKELTQFEMRLLEDENLEEAEIVEGLIVELCVELDMLIMVRKALYQIDFE